MIYTMALCAGRHNFPQDVCGSIFPQTINDPTDIRLIDMICDNTLCGHISKGDTLRVYVTGLTVCTVSLINWCNYNHVNLVLLHYNRASGTYYEQKIIY